MKKSLKWYWLRIQELVPWIVAALAVLSANLAANGIYESIQILADGKPVRPSPSIMSYVAFFIIMVFLFYRQRNALFLPHTRYLSNEIAEKRKHLVLFLSSVPNELEAMDGIPGKMELKFEDLEQDIRIIEKHKESNIKWSWEMPLRAINHHRDFLDTVTLICSKQSIVQSQLFVNICNRYGSLKNKTFFIVIQKSNRPDVIVYQGEEIDSSQGWDFESFDQLSSALWKLLKEFKRRNYLETEIMIDFTGGQKVTSVVAAAITFNRKIKAQYVQTNYPWKVLSYEVVFASTDTGSLGI